MASNSRIGWTPPADDHRRQFGGWEVDAPDYLTTRRHSPEGTGSGGTLPGRGEIGYLAHTMAYTRTGHMLGIPATGETRVYRRMDT